jgi:aminoglycoside phosphotransferase (APT) family kinase protein
MFRDFEPVGVLDWEMVGVGPREIDLGWMVFLHRFFEDLAAEHGFDSMPHFMAIDDVAATYERLSGHAPRNLDYFVTYSAVRDAIVMSRVKQRSILFGEDVKPDDPDDMVMHRRPLEQLLDGTYWESRPRTAAQADADAGAAG